MQTKKTKKIKPIRKIITIKREIYPDDRLKKFLEDNMRYRRYLYNKGVEVIRNHPDFNIWDFNKYSLSKYLYNEIEINDASYIDKAVGIRAAVCSDLDVTIKLVKANIMNGKPSDLHFTKYHPFKGSFRVENKHRDMVNARLVTIEDMHTIFYKANSNKDFINMKMHHYTIITKEPIGYKCDDSEYYYDKRGGCRFSNSDIREIRFVKDITNYYILLVVEAEYAYNIKNRKPLAGIDTGIHNPVMMFDGDFDKDGKAIFKTKRFNKKTLRRIEYLERRTRSLQTIMRRKYERNKELYPDNPHMWYSKNYKKVWIKFLKTWRRIVNIRKDWQFKEVFKLVTQHDVIVLDTFNQPDNSNKPDNDYTRNMNYQNRLHGMYNFNDLLINHMSIKYDCKIIEAPKKTTRTCSFCGYENPKLLLSERYLKCESCGRKFDRDKNAAINCYNYGIKKGY